jgi:hypothetical protein
MSKIRTVDDLSKRLYDDFVWRRTELSDLKSLINRDFPDRKHQALLRSSMAILYAHWEGYIKNSATCYLEFVSRQQLLYCELKTNFVAIAMKDKLKDAHETNKATVFAETAEFILHRSTEKSNLPYKGIVFTGSNLSSSILREIICLLGLDYSLFELKENSIDERLLGRRNTIAHGEYLSLDRVEYLELHEQVLEMMENFRDQIENSAVSGSYRR